jgi:hypothetical protein
MPQCPLFHLSNPAHVRFRYARASMICDLPVLLYAW